MIKFMIAVAVLFSGANSFANDLYPDAQRDRPYILQAASIRGVEMNNLEFSLSKQAITGTLTALSKIPELVGYLFGSKEGFATLHTITFEQKGAKLTCGAVVIVKPDNSIFAGVSNCGTESINYLGSDQIIPLTRVN